MHPDTKWMRKAIPAMVLVAAACWGNDPGGPIPPTRITRLQAFYCAVRNAAQCQARGDSIPSGTLPPTTEAFMVWVWHPGFNTTNWRLVSSLDSGEPPSQGLAQDSNAKWFNLNGAPAKKYTMRIEIVGQNNAVLAKDSLLWEYP